MYTQNSQNLLLISPLLPIPTNFLDLRWLFRAVHSWKFPIFTADFVHFLKKILTLYLLLKLLSSSVEFVVLFTLSEASINCGLNMLQGLHLFILFCWKQCLLILITFSCRKHTCPCPKNFWLVFEVEILRKIYVFKGKIFSSCIRSKNVKFWAKTNFSGFIEGNSAFCICMLLIRVQIFTKIYCWKIRIAKIRESCLGSKHEKYSFRIQTFNFSIKPSFSTY